MPYKLWHSRDIADIYPIEYMGFSHYSAMIIKFKVVTFLGFLI